MQGTIRWGLDVWVYILQDIFDMIHELGPKINDIEAVTKYSKPPFVSLPKQTI
jgi:hypothetical protein